MILSDILNIAFGILAISGASVLITALLIYSSHKNGK